MVMPQISPKSSDLQVYNITFYDSRSAEARHQSFPDIERLK